MSAAPDDAALLHIAAWLGRLARVTRYRQGRLSKAELEDLTAERRDYAEILARNLPTGAFCTDSLSAVTTELGASFYPAVEDIRRTVQAWWNENRPRLAPPVESPDSHAASLTPADRRWLDYFRKREAEGFAARQPGDGPSSRALVLSLVKAQSLAAWRVITSTPEFEHGPPDPKVAARIAANMANAFPTKRAPHEPIKLPRANPLGDFADVTVKGEALRRARQARGVQPLPPREPPPDSLHESEREGSDPREGES